MSNLLIIFISIIIPFFSLSAQEKSIFSVKRVLELDVHSSINPATLNYIDSGLKNAKQEDFNLVLIVLNTPGGLVTTTKDILTQIGESEIPVAVWIKPEGASATSAGAIIASGAHFLFMSEGTNIGAATPIEMSGDIKSGDLRNKAINDLVALVQSLAETRGRDPKGFGEMISKAVSFKAREALDKKLIDGIVNSKKELREALNGKSFMLKGEKKTIELDDVEFQSFEMDLGQKLLNILANPSLAYMLFLIAAALIYFELQAPGGFIAGSIGVVFLILAGIGFQVLPLNFGALGLIFLAFVLFILEIYITSFGLLSLAGMVSLIAGSLFLYRTDDAYLEMSNTVIISSSLAVGLFIAFIAFVIARDHKNIGQQKFNSMVGHRAVVLESLGEHMGAFEYQVKVQGEIWKFRSKEALKIGQDIKVKNQEDNILS
ncbi:MAG: nodulation protein NfeD [Bdellovibrio sp.]